MGKKDLNQSAKFIAGIATGEIPKPASKNQGQQLGGLKGGKARAEGMTQERRKEIAQKAAHKRWNKL